MADQMVSRSVPLVVVETQMEGILLKIWVLRRPYWLWVSRVFGVPWPPVLCLAEEVVRDFWACL